MVQSSRPISLGLRFAAMTSLGATLCAARAPARDPVAEIVATESAFAQSFAQSGWLAFIDFAADEAVWYDPPGFQPAKPLYRRLVSAPGSVPALSLDWWPSRVEVACSGDLAWSTGPVIRIDARGTRFSHYVTVWARGTSGEWRWIFDRGNPELKPAVEKKGARVAGRMSSPRCERGLRGDAAVPPAAQEQQLFARLRSGKPIPESFAARDVRVHRFGRLPAEGRRAWLAALAAEPRPVSHAPAGGRVSSDGELAFSFGSLAWTDPARGAQQGAYLHIWRRHRTGWELVLDQVTMATPPVAAGPA